MPTFFHGDRASAFIAGSYLRGLRGFDVASAYHLLLRNATVEGGTRPYLEEYIAKGYVTTPEVENPNVETRAKAGVTKTLEYAYDDYAVALLARALNDFIGIAGSGRSEERVAMRVSQGGHDVPTDKLAARFPRTMTNLKQAIRELPCVLVFDNDDLRTPFRLLAVFQSGRQKFLTKSIPDWLEPLL